MRGKEKQHSSNLGLVTVPMERHSINTRSSGGIISTQVLESHGMTWANIPESRNNFNAAPADCRFPLLGEGRTALRGSWGP